MKNRRRAALFAAVFTTGLLGTAVAASAETLAEAIASAYDTNPNMKIARGDMRNADEAYFRARRNGLFPSISASFSSSGNRRITTGTACVQRDEAGNCTRFISSTTSSSEQGSASLNVNQQVYSGGRLTAQIKQAEISLLQARENLRGTEAQLVQQVVDAYLTVRSAQESLEIQKASLESVQQQKDEALARFEEGASTRTDVANADTQLASSQASLAQQTAALENARAAYRTIVGHDPEDLQPQPSLEGVLPSSPGEALQVARVNNRAMRQVYLQERNAAVAVSAQRANRRPTVTTSLGVTYQPDILGQQQSTGVTGTVNLNVPIFPNTTLASNIRTAEENYRLYDVRIEQQQRDLLQQVNQQWNSLQSQRSRITAQEAAVRAARLAYEGTREQLAVQLSTARELLDAETRLRQAEQTLVEARYSEYRAAINLLNTMGRLDAELLAPQIVEYDPMPHFEQLNDFELPWDGVLRTIDRIGAPAIPKRTPLPDEVIPTFDENF